MADRGVSKHRFLQLSKELHARARAMGGILVVNYKSNKSTKFISGSLECEPVFGHYNALKRKAVVNIIGKPKRWLILAVMAHELRHMEQHTTGLFKDYFRLSDVVKLWKWAASHADTKMPNIKRLSNRTAWLAERDADRSAMSWMNKNKVKFNKEKFTNTYSGSEGYKQTMAYRLNNDIDRKLVIKAIIMELGKKRSKRFLTTETNGDYNV